MVFPLTCARTITAKQHVTLPCRFGKVHMLSHGRACPLGLAAWGPGGRSGLVSGGLAFGIGIFSGLD